MLDFDASKLLIIGVVALVVIGPKDLPRVLRQVGQMVGKLRRMAGDFQGQFMEAMKEADLQDLRDEVSKLKGSATLDVAFNPVHDIRNEITKAVETRAETSGMATGEIPSGELGPVRSQPEAPALRHLAGSGDAIPVSALAETEVSLGAAALIEMPEHLAAEPEDPPNLAAAGIGPVAGEVDFADASGQVRTGGFETATLARRRRILVPKRRGPGDRMRSPLRGPLVQTRLILPPRRDPRP